MSESSWEEPKADIDSWDMLDTEESSHDLDSAQNSKHDTARNIAIGANAAGMLFGIFAAVAAKKRNGEGGSDVSADGS